ncbi:hypothetical protein L7F22_005918 [Adiantum nelumboides]|nr:hypothetical protein [Adiantum nelumboides]
MTSNFWKGLFLSRFNFHIAHIAGKHNQMDDALSRRPKVNAVSIATHNDLSSMIDEYVIDPDFKDVISAIALGKKEAPFTLEDGYLLHGNRLCITHSLREKVMYESHAPPYAGHRGIQTTLKAIETYFYWPTMKRDIPDYVSKCVVCQKTKFDRGKQPGLLQPLPIPDSPWESISMDFIFGLPKSIHGNMGIWTIVDRMTSNFWKGLFLSRFNFHIAQIAGKHNQMDDALSRRPKVNAVSIATHNDLSSMIDEYVIDPDFKDVISAIALGKKEAPFTLEDGYLLHGNRLCITHSLREKVMYESHAPPYAGHRGIQTILKAIETYFYWPTMKRDIPDYVSKCVVCQKTKFDRGKQPGLLQPLPIPDSPWESISMDFIFGLPKSIHGNTGIWTIVDRFSKQAHFIPVKKTNKAHQMAILFISQIFKYHGLPTSIVSDRDSRMTSNFWKGLFENLGTRLNFSSAYNPQTDGQSEIANLTILDLLKSYVTKVDQRSQWEKYLPLVEYAYNNTVHTSTRKAPFEVIEGRPKIPLLLKVHGKIFAANEYNRDLKESFQKIKEAICISQQKQKAATN